MLHRFVVLFVLLFASIPALAGGIAVVDFQRAVNETNEGKDAQKKLDTMYASRKVEVDRIRGELEKEIRDFQSRATILSEQARMDEEKRLMQKQAQFEQLYMQYQQEMQQTYMTLLQDLDTKMRAMSKKIADEKGYDLVIDAAAVVAVGSGVTDMTGDLVTRYNAGK